jgi:hypothetical protein
MYAGSERTIIIHLMPYSSHLTPSLDMRVFEIFKIFHKNENAVRGLKRETLKIYHTIVAFYKSTIVQMVR